VLFLEKLSPALEHVDSSSGAILHQHGLTTVRSL